MDFEEAGAQDLAAGNVVVGREPEPRAEVLARREPRHVRPDSRNDGLRDRFGDADDVDQIDAEQAQQMGARVVGGLVFGVAILLGVGLGHDRRVADQVEARRHGGELRIERLTRLRAWACRIRGS